MPTPQSKQALRDDRKAKGLCIHCGAQADRGTRCSACAARDAENRKRYRERDKAAGVCTVLGCHNKTTNGRASCTRCLGKQRLAEHERMNSKFCMKCTNVRDTPNSAHCAVCRAKRVKQMQRFVARRRANGQCVRCGDYLHDKAAKRCEVCLAKGRERHAALKVEVMAAYGGPVCVGCGEDEILILQIDHVAGGGCRHAEEIGGRGKLYVWLKDNHFPPGFRVLCPNCNMRAARGIPFPSIVED